MGIYDRDYYGDNQRDGRDFFMGEGAAVRTLIFANVLVYIGQIASRGTLESLFAADTASIWGGQFWRLFTNLKWFTGEQVTTNSISLPASSACPFGYSPKQPCILASPPKRSVLLGQ